MVSGVPLWIIYIFEFKRILIEFPLLEFTARFALFMACLYRNLFAEDVPSKDDGRESPPRGRHGLAPFTKEINGSPFLC